LPLFKKKKKGESEESPVEEKKRVEEKVKEGKTREGEEKKRFKLGFSRRGRKKEKKVEEKPILREEEVKEEKPVETPVAPTTPAVTEAVKREERVEEEKPVEAGEKKEKKEKRGFKLFGRKKAEKPKPIPTKAKPAKKPRPVLRISPRRTKPRMRERGILTAEVYKTVTLLIIEGFAFGSLAAILLYVALTGLMDSPVIKYIADYLALDTATAFMLFLIPVGMAVGLLAGDLAIKSQRGIGLVSLLSRRGRKAPTAPAPAKTPPLHPGRISLAGLSLIIPATGLLVIYLFPTSSISLLFGAVMLGVGVVISLYLFMTALRPAPPLPWYAALATELRTIKPEESQKLAQLVRTAGVSASPSVVMARYVAVAIILSFLLIPAGVLTGFAIYYGYVQLDIAIVLIGIFILALVGAMYYPYIRFNQLKNERKRLVEKDLPFFAIYTSILQSAGLFIDHAFRRLIGNPLFPGIEREARILEKEIKLGKDPLEALTALALDHPSKRFKDFIFGYTSVVKSGWDALSYISMRIREYIQEIKFNWKMYSEKAGGMGELLIVVFMMTTVLFVLIAVVLPYGVEQMMSVFNFLVLPLMTVLLIQSMDALVPQPRIKNYYKSNFFIIVATPLIVLIALMVLEISDIIIVMSALAISLLLAIGIDYQIQHAEVKGIESALPEFLRDVTEYRKIGFPMLRAFFMIKETGRKYNKHFDRLLNTIIAQLRAGIRLNKVRVPTRSWLGRFVFWLLGEIEDTGGGTPAVLEEFTGLITDLLDARENARRQLRIYNILAYITPAFLIVFVAIGIAINNMIKEVTASQAEAIKQLKGGGVNVQLPIMLRPADQAIFHAKISVFISSVLLSIAMTKAVDLTPRNTIRTTIIATVALFLIYTVDIIANLLVSMMISGKKI